jgi:DNA-binding transcriptional MerR regulator
LEKASSAFRTISEVADELAVPKHVLRFWEGKFPQLRPMKRGGGRRYYRPEDVDLLRGIRSLLYDDGYTIKGVQRILRGNGVRFVKECWRSDASERETAVNIPDLAKDAADARREKISPGTAQKAKADVKVPTLMSKDDEVKEPRLASVHHMALTVVLSELEECRKMLQLVHPTGNPNPLCREHF